MDAVEGSVGGDGEERGEALCRRELLTSCRGWGERTLIVWTRDTAILPVAMEDAMCPATWKTDRGAVVERTCFVGLRNPPERPGIERASAGMCAPRKVRRRHQPATKANCRIVTVMGYGKALRIDFELVLLNAELKYL